MNLSSILTFAILVLGVGLLFTIFSIVCWWKIYKKMGEPGWASIIPIYNSFVLFRRVWDVKAFFAFLGTIALSIAGSMLLSAANAMNIEPLKLIGIVVSFISALAMIIIFAIAYFKMCDKFNKGVGFFILFLLLPIVGLPILAFSKDKYTHTDFIGGGECFDKEDDGDETMQAIDNIISFPDTIKETRFEPEYHSEASYESIAYEEQEDDLEHTQELPRYAEEQPVYEDFNEFESEIIDYNEDDNFRYKNDEEITIETSDIKVDDDGYKNIPSEETFMDDIKESDISLEMDGGSEKESKPFKMNPIKGRDPSDIKIIDQDIILIYKE